MPVATPRPARRCGRGSHDSVITNPALGFAAVMEYVSEWQAALGYGGEVALPISSLQHAPKGRSAGLQRR